MTQIAVHLKRASANCMHVARAPTKDNPAVSIWLRKVYVLRERDRQTDRQTDRQRQRQTERDRGTETETDRETDRDRNTERQTENSQHINQHSKQYKIMSILALR